MTTQAKTVLAEALDLPPIERAGLIERLLASFEFPSSKKKDALWAKEAESRIDAFEQGKIKAISAKKVFESLRVFYSFVIPAKVGI